MLLHSIKHDCVVLWGVARHYFFNFFWDFYWYFCSTTFLLFSSTYCKFRCMCLINMWVYGWSRTKIPKHSAAMSFIILMIKCPISCCFRVSCSVVSITFGAANTRPSEIATNGWVYNLNWRWTYLCTQSIHRTCTWTTP